PRAAPLSTSQAQSVTITLSPVGLRKTGGPRHSRGRQAPRLRVDRTRESCWPWSRNRCDASQAKRPQLGGNAAYPALTNALIFSPNRGHETDDFKRKIINLITPGGKTARRF